MAFQKTYKITTHLSAFLAAFFSFIALPPHSVYGWESKIVVTDIPSLEGMPDDKMYQEVKKIIGNNPDVFRRSVRRLGNRTIEMQTLLSTDGSFKYVSRILSDIKSIPDWALENINVPPPGSDYNFKILGATLDPQDPSVLGFSFRLDVPVFKYQGSRKFKLKADKRKDVFILSGEALPTTDSVVESVRTTMRVYPSEKSSNRVWIAAYGTVVLRSWLLYEAMPDRMVGRESSSRIQKLLDNYLRREDKIREKEENLDAPTPIDANLVKSDKN